MDNKYKNKYRSVPNNPKLKEICDALLYLKNIRSLFKRSDSFSHSRDQLVLVRLPRLESICDDVEFLQLKSKYIFRNFQKPGNVPIELKIYRFNN